MDFPTDVFIIPHQRAPWSRARPRFEESPGLLRDAALQQVDLAQSHEELCITVVEAQQWAVA